jgi:choline kinase
MRAIIMAAGVGSRLQGITGGRPKCLIQAGEQTLLARMIGQLQDRGIHDISVITGYKSALVHAEFPLGVRKIHNPFYRVTNSIASLWLARGLLTEDTLLMNADLYFESEVLDIALAQCHPVAMLSDCTRIESADFRFRTRGDRIVAAGKNIPDAETDCEYVGIVRLDRDFIETFRTRLEKMINEGCFGDWWEAVLYSFLGEHVQIRCADVGAAFWTEVDHAVDYARLESWLARRSPKLVRNARTAGAEPLSSPSLDMA